MTTRREGEPTDRDNPVPFYHRIAAQVRREIAAGRYKTGQPIPTEAALQARFGVSRLTVREAVRQLVSQGLLEKKQGKGTFVTRPSVDHRKGFLYSPSEAILAHNHLLATRVIETRIVRASAAVAARLNLKPGEEVFSLERLRSADKVPAQLIKSYLPYRLVRGIEKVDFTVCFLYRVLEDACGLRLKDADEVIGAALLDRRTASLLHLRRGQPVLLTRRTTFLLDGTPVEYNEILYRPDVLSYRIKLEGRDQSRIIRQQFVPAAGGRAATATRRLRKGGAGRSAGAPVISKNRRKSR